MYKKNKNKSVAIDLNESVLNWTQKYSLSKLTNSQQKRIKLINQNVLDYRNSFVDIAYALNFSYCYFKERETLKNYFKNIITSVLELDNHSDIYVITTGNPKFFGWGGKFDFQYNESEKIEKLIAENKRNETNKKRYN